MQNKSSFSDNYSSLIDSNIGFTNNDPLMIAGYKFSSRLLLGSGKFLNQKIAKAALEASGCEIVTMAVRRVKFGDDSCQITSYIDPSKYTYLPNSAGCYSAIDAVRVLKLARELSNGNLVKLEVIGDKKTLYPNMQETLKAAEILVKDNFAVMVYCSDDICMAKQLEEIGCAAIMPLAAPIGSGLGILNKINLQIIVENAKIPVLVDAGIGTSSDATIAMELGCSGVLLNSAVASAKDPVTMAFAMKHAVIAGRLAYLSGRMDKNIAAIASSSNEGIIK